MGNIYPGSTLLHRNHQLINKSLLIYTIIDWNVSYFLLQVDMLLSVYALMVLSGHI